LEHILTNPWFWAFLATIGWFMGFGVIGSHTLGNNIGFGITMLILAELPCILLPLSFVNQPRFESSGLWLIGLGVFIFAISLGFGTPLFRITPLTRPHRKNPLRIDGLYALIRHPFMLCDIIWPLRWSLIFGSVLGTVLTPIWWLVIYILTYVEEEALVQEYGDAYREYQARVPRFIPRLIHKTRR
jgi:protein-S-isoprenylcysteine O-methyltransferase Ste14